MYLSKPLARSVTVVGAAVAVLIAGLLIDQSAVAQSANLLRAGRLQIFDSGNNLRVNMGASGQNEEFTHLAMIDRDGVTRLAFTVYTDGKTPILQFFDKNKKVVATIPATRRFTSRPSGSNEVDDGKADSASFDDVLYLKGEIENLSRQLAELKSRNNLK